MNLRELNVKSDLTLLYIDLEGVRFVTSPITLPGHAESWLRVGITKDCVLVVQTPKRARSIYGDRHVLLVAIVTAKHRFSVELNKLAGVVFMGDEFKVENEPKGNKG
ncbi:hypothetical protein ACJJIW_12110 [Microbulbifer sp. JMSA004]|uniref:hypothetical protein n=1 Tax=unclassified Microbulbifer TaxID=2619833 RepID=UPI0024AD2032|nr:hypothetical protein [Microbulbifer sp. VAAF005]WHI46048.1 hypothetical protein P0078_20355 [Microbulbifer sp. VAAF005]